MALVIAVFLIATLLIAGKWPAGASGLRPVAPLDVDEGMPFPEASQASSVFSLTALFGPYLALSIVFGLPALIGLFLGTVLGLFLLCRYFAAYPNSSFHSILNSHVCQRQGPAVLLAILIAITQACFATSELLILRDVSSNWLQMGKSNAAVFTVFIALIGYLYCLRGGYTAVFRTDIVQFVFVLAMAVMLAVLVIRHQGPNAMHTATVGSYAQLWFPSITGSFLHAALTTVVCATMGVVFIVASPDIWKRVFVVSRKRARRPLLRLVVVGSLPFLVITPILSLPRPSTLEDLAFLQFLSASVAQNDIARLVIILGLVAAFLSSFDSALVASTHCAILGTTSARYTRKDYHRMIGLTFLSINLLFILLPMISVTNPYFLANVLIANYAVIGGVLLGTRGLRERVVTPRVLTCIAISTITLWTTYLAGGLRLFHAPNEGHLESILYGVIVFLTIFAVVRLMRMRGNIDG